MFKKSIRILIADEQHFNRLRIERWFNQLGYYRVAPVQDMAELLVLVEYASEPFDLLIINAAMGHGKLDLLDFCLDNHQLDRVMIYDGQRAQLPAIALCAQRKVSVSHALLPDLASIQRLMALADSRRPSVGTVISVR
ncbi:MULTISPECIES: response regulator [unclassified Pseudomonas]|uniref:response regulator n=1 Tax=unclassified Pseudomonas TaxID=196821 RepID=UPI001032C520|nr:MULTISPECIES: response regulator [unclassified Pseudomonas]